MKHITELRSDFNSVNEGQIIKIDNSQYKVLVAKQDDFLFLQNIEDESKMFHLFYDDLDVEKDQFTIVK